MEKKNSCTIDTPKQKSCNKCNQENGCYFMINLEHWLKIETYWNGYPMFINWNDNVHMPTLLKEICRAHAQSPTIMPMAFFTKPEKTTSKTCLNKAIPKANAILGKKKKKQNRRNDNTWSQNKAQIYYTTEWGCHKINVQSTQWFSNESTYTWNQFDKN